MLTLTLKESPRVPLEAENLSPDVLAPLSLEQIRKLPIFLGKRQLMLEELFDIEGTPGEQLELRGDLSRVKWIGRGMTRGSIRIAGAVGMHLGAYMKGGRIDVQGRAGDWVGGEMSGGIIHIQGDAGGQLGAAYRGSASGMSGGMILVEGTSGIEVGMRMKRGLIAIRGRVRDFAGLQMKGGTIVLMSGAEIRTGAWMSRGTIISLQPLKILPTFGACCLYRPSFLTLYSRALKAHGFELPDSLYHRHIGDLSIPGKGELLVQASA